MKLGRPIKRDVLFVTAIITLYALSLALPAGYDMAQHNNQMTGLFFLFIGWLGISVGWFAWYANPFLLWALIALIFKRYM